jgi:nitrogen regulatory protein PII
MSGGIEGWYDACNAGRALATSPRATTKESAMQMIEAVVKPSKLDAIKTALAALGILGVTAVECKGFGRQMGHTERYRGAKLDVGFVPKIMLKVCVKSEDVDKAITAIVENARTGQVGDGKIFVYPVSRVIRIRTGEADEAAL